MDEKRLRQILHEIAEQEISEDMNLLPEIMAQLENTNTPRTRKSAWRMGRTLALVALLMMSVAVAYAVYRQQSTDPGLDAARDNNLVTTLEMSQTLEDVTLTLNWMYADAHRIALGYSITAPEGQAAYAYSSSISVIDEDNSFYASSGGGSGGGGAFGAPADFTASFGVGFFENPPEELNMRVEIILGIDPNNAGMGGGGGSGGGGGGFGYGGGDPEATPVPGIVIPYPATLENPIGPFVFEFTMPYIAEIVVEPMQTVEVSGVSMRLESLSITPSMTIARLCYNYRNSIDWQLQTRVTMNDVSAASTGWGTVDIEPCFEFNYPAAYLGEPTTLTLTVTRMSRALRAFYPPDAVEEFVTILRENGIEMEITRTSNSFSYNVASAPEGVDTGLAVSEAWFEAFNEFVDGPWIFTVEIP